MASSDFVVEDGELKEYNGPGGDVVVPDGVTSIGGSVFSHCEDLTSVQIPESVTSIGNYAFYNCGNLTSVTIPNGVTSIGTGAFYGCERLADRNGYLVFGGILLQYFGPGGDLVIPDTVVKIKDYMFEHCDSITSVMIPDSVTSIGDVAFFDCNNLASICVAPTNSHYCSVDGVLFDKQKRTLLRYPAARGGDYTIPDGVTNIAEAAFLACDKLTSLTIPGSVTSIGNRAFAGCGILTCLAIPDGVTSIEGVLSGCVSLTNVTIPDSVTSIGEHAFSGCTGLTSVAIPNSVTRIGEYAFDKCTGLTSVVIPSSVTSIERAAFSECSGLISATIPDSVTNIGDYAFYKCINMKSLSLPKTWPSMAKDAFSRIGSKDICYLLSKEFTVGKEKVPSFICGGRIDFDWTSKELACIALYQTDKLWQSWLRQGQIKAPASVLESMLTLLRQEKSVEKKVGMQAVQFAKDFGKQIPRDSIVSLIALLKEKRWSGSKSLEKDAAIQAIIANEAPEEHPIEALVRETLSVNPPVVSLQKIIKSGIHYADGTGSSSREALLLILSESKREWERCAEIEKGEFGDTSVLRDAGNIRFSETADRVAAALDRRELTKFLKEQVSGRTYRASLLAFARYADNKGIEALCSIYARLGRKSAGNYYKAISYKEALLLSDTPAAMRFFDKQGELDRYAAMRNMSAADMRNSMPADFFT